MRLIFYKKAERGVFARNGSIILKLVRVIKNVIERIQLLEILSLLGKYILNIK